MAVNADTDQMTKLRWAICVLASTGVAFTCLEREGNIFAEWWAYLWPILWPSLFLLVCAAEVQRWRRRRDAAR